MPKPQSTPASTRVRSPIVSAAAQIMNYVSQETETALAESLQQEDDLLYKQIDEQRVTMDDLIGIDKKAMQKILASIDTRVLTVASSRP